MQNKALGALSVN